MKGQKPERADPSCVHLHPSPSSQFTACGRSIGVALRAVSSALERVTCPECLEIAATLTKAGSAVEARQARAFRTIVGLWQQHDPAAAYASTFGAKVDRILRRLAKSTLGTGEEATH